MEPQTAWLSCHSVRYSYRCCRDTWNFTSVWQVTLHHKIHRFSHFLLVSAEAVNLVLRVLCVSTLFAPCFGFSWPASSCYSLERVCPSDHGRPIHFSSILSSNIHVACAFLCWSILVTWPPFPYETVSHCCDSVRVGSLLISAFVTLSTTQQCSPFHLPLTSSEYLLFLLHERPCMGCHWHWHSKDRAALIFMVKQL